MLTSPSLLPALPETYGMSRSHFLALLDRYGQVVVKPSGGWGGDGVLFISRQRGGSYEIVDGRKKQQVLGAEEAYLQVAGKTKAKPHVVQRKIDLAAVGGRPFDVRVVVQRKQSSDWAVTGILAKIAGPGYRITNVERSRGRVVPLSAAILQSNIQGKSAGRIQAEVTRMGLQSAELFRQHYGVRKVGLDIGIDVSGKPWIIEANFKPADSLFRKLKDKSMYRKIVSLD
ncbi:YheC/YheD family protein [Cohnella fermenti]|nr:YheC/YheD family protein [Cohnella fermenti]